MAEEKTRKFYEAVVTRLPIGGGGRTFSFRVNYDNFKSILPGDLITFKDELGIMHSEIVEKVSGDSIITIGRKEDESPFETDNIYKKHYYFDEIGNSNEEDI